MGFTVGERTYTPRIAVAMRLMSSASRSAERRARRSSTLAALAVVGLVAWMVTLRAAAIFMPFTEARPILADLRADLLPADLRDLSPEQRAGAWPSWVMRHDAEVRSRLLDGDEDSIANLTLFGTSFTREPRVTEIQISDMAAGKPAPPALQARIEAMASASAAPGDNERLQFVRDVARGKGFDPQTAAGQERVRQWLSERVARIVDEYRRRAAVLYDPSATPTDQSTLFRARGLSSDTTLFPGFAIEQALDALKSHDLVAPRAIRRVAIVGPGLDFSDKEEGYDFYPQQTIQPFAVIDSLRRLGLAPAADLRVATFDLSPRVNHHIEAARARAQRGESYVLQLPREMQFTWTPFLDAYWTHFGDQIGEPAAPLAAPSADIRVRAVRVRPEIVGAITPGDLNIVLQRVEPIAAEERFDLVVATNILLYYDVFEQSLALRNIAAMLKPGGYLLSNTNIATLPSIPMELVGYTDVGYTDRPEGDRVFWIQRHAN